MRNFLHILGIVLLLIPFQIEAQEEKDSDKLTSRGATVEKDLDAVWDHALGVKNGEEFFDDAAYHTYRITVYDLKNKKLEKYWKDELEHSKKIKGHNKKGVISRTAEIPEISSEPLEVYAKTEEGDFPNSSFLYVAFLKDGTDIGPKSHPELHKKAENMMYDLSVKLNKDVVKDQLLAQEKTMEDLQKDLDKLKHEHEKLQEEIVKNEERLEDAEQKQEEEEEELAQLREEIEDYEAKIGDNPSAEELKQLSKYQKEEEKLERSISKLTQQQVDYRQNIAEAEEAIPLNEKAQEAKIEELENHKKVVLQYRKKLENVQ